ncbi:hypothetical protein SynPROSU1_02201 [Synechococcus sp. PROS-U-1]|nr:hypothetical protein SynPROSU1_02201 [Synechococcus sp. PROS-U-1]
MPECPADINTRPRPSQTTAWTRCTDSVIDPRRRQTSRGADPDRAAGLKPEGKVIGHPD